MLCEGVDESGDVVKCEVCCMCRLFVVFCDLGVLCVLVVL